MKKTEKTNEIKSSSNYEWFKFLGNNRKISKKHLSNLRKQFEEYGNITEISPITVNKNGFIIDGQHRFMLCQEFGLPVHYNEIDLKKEITPAINSNSRPWNARDYIEFFAAYKPEYELLKRFMDHNELAWAVAKIALFPRKSTNIVYSDLKEGKLEVSEYLEQAQQRADILNEMMQITGQILSERYTYNILRCLYMDKFDIVRFMDKLKMVMNKNGALPQLRATNNFDVMRNIEAIYNFYSQEKNTVMLFR